MTGKTYKQVQAERRARGGDSAKLADLTDRMFRNALTEAAKDARINAGKAEGGTASAWRSRHPELFALITEEYRRWLAEKPLGFTGRITLKALEVDRKIYAARPDLLNISTSEQLHREARREARKLLS